MRFILLCLVAASRDVQVLVEQPSGSIMLDLPYWKYFALVIAPIAWTRYACHALSHEKANIDPYVVFSNAKKTKAQQTFQLI